MDFFVALGGILFIGTMGMAGVEGILSLYKKYGLKATTAFTISLPFFFGVIKAMFFSIMSDFATLTSGNLVSGDTSRGFLADFSRFDWFFLIGFVVSMTFFVIFAYKERKQ